MSRAGVGARVAVLGGERSHTGPEVCAHCGGAREAHLAPGTWDAGTWITDDPRAGGSLSRTCARRPRGTPKTSWTPCTPSASRPCSTFTWLPSLTPSLSGVCWEKPPTVLRWGAEVGVWGVGVALVFHQPCPSPSSGSMAGLRRLLGSLGSWAEESRVLC